MPEYPEIIDRLFAHVDNLATTLEAIPQPIHDANDMIVNSLLNDGKIFIAGEARQSILCSYFSAILLSKYEHERPALPAFNLCGDHATVSTLAQDHHSLGSIFSNQIQALALPQDILVLFSSNDKESSIIQAIQAAHDKEINCIIFAGAQHENLNALKGERDVIISVPQDKQALIIESHLLIINILGELIDEKLFGV